MSIVSMRNSVNEPGTDAERQLAHQHQLQLQSRCEVLVNEPIDPRFTDVTTTGPAAVHQGAWSQTSITVSQAGHRAVEANEKGLDEEPIYVLRCTMSPHTAFAKY